MSMIDQFETHMTQWGASWVLDDGVISRDSKQLFWIAGVSPLIENLRGDREAWSSDFASSQTCLRMNMFDQIGEMESNHISFSMLGHFSFYRYSSKEAREWAMSAALDFLVSRLGLSQNHVVVTVHPEDHLSYKIWEGFNFPEKRILQVREKHTAEFMSGLNGYRTKIGWLGSNGLMKFWDLVFIEFSIEDGKLEPLPRIIVDSGMSLDRLLMVAENKTLSYHTSRWRELCFHLSQIVGLRQFRDTELWRLADVGRAAGILLLAGVRPGSKQREYVLRKLIREVGVLTGIPGNPEIFEEVFRVLLHDAFHQYPQNAHVESSSVALEISKRERSSFEDVISRGLRKREQLLARNDGTLSKAEKDILRSSYGLPRSLI